MNVIEVVVPVFAVVLVGYLAAYSGVIKAEDNDGLSRFVFNIALPVLLFNSLAKMTLPQQFNWQFFVSYYAVVLVIYGLGAWLSKRWFAVSAQEQGVLGMGAAYSNLVLIGLPIISAGLGDEALLPLFLLVSVHSAVLFFLSTVMVERGDGNGRSLQQIAVQTGKSLARNPIIIGLVFGLIANFLSVPIPGPLDEAIALLSRAALPCSLFVLGASLTAYKISGHFAEAWLIISLKLFLQPLLVWVLVFHVFKMDPLWSAVAVMAAGMPVGINAYMFAQKYRVGIAVLSTAVLLSTILAVISESIWLLLLT
ncbi:MAG: AEC family transporter [Ardenticatenaceae bacterium]|nr:AEC family transporter [Ardenticatenaceae bacterium]